MPSFQSLNGLSADRSEYCRTVLFQNTSFIILLCILFSELKLRLLLFSQIPILTKQHLYIIIKQNKLIIHSYCSITVGYQTMFISNGLLIEINPKCNKVSEKSKMPSALDPEGFGAADGKTDIACGYSYAAALPKISRQVGTEEKRGGYCKLGLMQIHLVFIMIISLRQAKLCHVNVTY